MARALRRHSMKIPSYTSDASNKSFEKREAPHLRYQFSVVSKNILDSKSGKTRMVGRLPKPLNTTRASLPLKCAGTINKLSGQGMHLMESKAHSAAVTRTLEQERLVTSDFLGLRCDKGRMLRSKTTPVQIGKKILQDAGKVNRISHRQTLQLLQALMKEPLSFLELRGRFGVSRQTIKTLVRNGQLTEIWGPKAVGVRFVLSEKGRIYSKGLEAAAK